MRKSLLFLLPLFVACSDRSSTATGPLPKAPAFALAAPTGIAVDSVVGMTVFASWQDNAADNNGFYLVLSTAPDVNATKKYQIVYGGDATSGSITAYAGEAGCYLVSVFAWGVSDTDSAWSTTGPVSVGGAPCDTTVGAASTKRHGGGKK